MTQHVLVAVDGSTCAHNALEHALEEYTDAEITVTHVISPIAIVAVSEPAAWDDRLIERAREEAEELLAEIRETANERDVAIETEIVYGSVPRAIIEYAGEHDADQIIIGSHGRTGFSRVLLGSVAESVVRRAPIPVTVVR